MHPPHDPSPHLSNPPRRSTESDSQISISLPNPLPDYFEHRNRKFLPCLKLLTFYRLHLLCFVVICFAGSVLLFVTPKREFVQVSYIDALFNVVSATTVTGLVTISTEELCPFDDVLLMVLMLLGGQIFTSLVPLYVRRYVFYRHILKLEEEYRQAAAWQGIVLGPDIKQDDGSSNCKVKVTISEPDCTAEPEALRTSTPARKREIYLAAKAFLLRVFEKIWGRRLLKRSKLCSSTREDIRRHGTPGDESDPAQRLYLEHDASVLLCRVVILYFVGVQCLGFVIILMCIVGSPEDIHVLRRKHLNKGLFSSFTSIAMFSNAGFSLANENLIAFRQSSVLLLWLSLLILMGNTMFAPCLRGIIWLLHHHTKGRTKLAYRYLLNNPRKCYTHLFPHNQTMWLIYTIMAFNATECFFFFVLDWKSAALQGLSPLRKLAVGFFQSISTRNCGANVVNMGDLSPSMLVMYVGLMYVAVYPVYISRQNTRVKENIKPFHKEKTQYQQVMLQSQRLLARDSAYLFAAVFLICLCEHRKVQNDGLNFSIFNIIFEVISAYGNVGLSVGYSCKLNNSGKSCTDVPWSLSAKFDVESKLLMVLVMLLGRHRGLPENIDVAVRVPHRTASYASMTSIPPSMQSPSITPLSPSMPPMLLTASPLYTTKVEES